jgi:NHL repeat
MLDADDCFCCCGRVGIARCRPDSRWRQTVVPFNAVPIDVAVDAAGNLYVTDNVNNRVLKLPAGWSTETVLPFTGLKYPDGVAVDGAATSTSPNGAITGY